MAAQAPDVHGAKDVGHEYHYRHQLCWTMDPDMVLGSSLSSDFSMVPVGNAGNLSWHEPKGSVILKPPHDPGSGPRSRASAMPLMVTEVLTISTGPVCSRATAPELVLATAQAYTMPWP